MSEPNHARPRQESKADRRTAQALTVAVVVAGFASMIWVVWTSSDVAPASVAEAAQSDAPAAATEAAPETDDKPVTRRQAPEQRPKTPAAPAPSETPAPRQQRQGATDRPDAAPENAPKDRPSNLVVPVAGIERSDLRDSYHDARSGGRTHFALDIMAPRRTPVLAATDGVIRRLFKSRQGGITIYQFGPDETFCYYYAHLDSYADGLAEGDAVRRGQVIGYVGSSGNAAEDAPHLHFSISRLGPEKRWWKGDPINPYPLLSRPGR